MRITAGKPKGKTVVRFVFQGDTGDFKQAAKDYNFSGKERELLDILPGKPARRLIVAGLGRKKAFTTEKLRRAAATVAARVRSLGLEEVSITLPPGNRAENAQSAVEGFALALYRYDRYKSGTKSSAKLQTVRVDGPDHAVRRGDVYVRATCLTRDLINEPPSDCTPRRLAASARSIAKRGVTAKVLDEKQIRKAGMGGLIGVSLGSSEPPRFVHLRYRAPGARKTIAIVGKGITFDSGGLCLKSPDGMLQMKCDMSGAATVIGVLSALPDLKPRVNVHGIIAATENMPGASAYKTRDVLRALNGKTMEIINTDAEGRLVLADALSYASRLKPDQMVDLATLTGACVVALGMDIAGLFTADAKLRDRLVNAAEKQGEKIWPMPLEDEYRQLIRSDVADMKNAGPRWGGAITAALFLREFVDAGIPWAHVDIAGPAFSDRPMPYRTAGATGAMVRTLLRYLEQF